VIRGTAQNPDVFFQSRERANPFYRDCATSVADAMERFARITGRRYAPFEYHGAPDAETVIVIMGSGAEAVHETVDALVGRGEKVGVLKVRLYRPFDAKRFLDALPASVRQLTVLDRTKEPGAGGEPLYLDVVNAIYRAKRDLDVSGGRYGLSSKEFTPAMAKAVYDSLGAARPVNHFTVGISDDVSHTSLDYDPAFITEDPDVVGCIFYGLGADSTAERMAMKAAGLNRELATIGE
jgi:pyruvate-ferredoxin/flavodoxin oxidoreductase